MVMVTWCSASGSNVQKSQLLSALRIPLRGSRLIAWLRSGKRNGSRKKNTGVLLPTMSQLPSSVYNLSAVPRISRSASAAPRSPATVEKRANIGVCLPISEKIFAFVKRVMSCVTVKVPWAPQPFACMRRSGITSRSKCASFSSSQMSCNSAGPRGPAVMMLVLSATGAPFSLVKRLVCDIKNPPPWMDGERWANCSLSGPGGGAAHAAEILGPEGVILIGEHIGLDVAEGRLGSGMDGVVKGLDDLFLEAAGARVCVDDGFALGLSELGIRNAKHVHLDAGGNKRNDGMHELRNAGCRVQRDRGPDRLDVALGDAMPPQEVPSRIRAVHLEALIRT